MAYSKKWIVINWIKIEFELFFFSVSPELTFNGDYVIGEWEQLKQVYSVGPSSLTPYLKSSK